MTTTQASGVEYLELPTGTSDERFEGYLRLIVELFRTDDPDETTRLCLSALIDLANTAGTDPALCVSFAHAARVFGEELGLSK